MKYFGIPLWFAYLPATKISFSFDKPVFSIDQGFWGATVNALCIDFVSRLVPETSLAKLQLALEV